MAGVFRQQGDIVRAIALYEQVASTLAQISAYSDLVTVLSNLGLTVDLGRSKTFCYQLQEF